MMIKGRQAPAPPLCVIPAKAGIQLAVQLDA